MAIGFNVTVETRAARRQLQQIRKQLDGRAMLSLVGQRHLREVDDTFRRQGRLNERWKALAPSTREARRKRGKGAQILQDSGTLKRSFTTLNLSSREVSIGTNVQYAQAHEEGTRPRTIRVRNRKVLTIPSPSGPVKFAKGRLAGARGFFARQVRHPGLPRRPILPGRIRATLLARQVLEAALDKITKGASRGTR